MPRPLVTILFLLLASQVVLSQSAETAIDSLKHYINKRDSLELPTSKLDSTLRALEAKLNTPADSLKLPKIHPLARVYNLCL